MAPGGPEERLARGVAEAGLPGASAAVVRDGAVEWAGGSGFVDLESGRRAAADTLYRIASITKTFTATAVLQLRDDGRLSLDDPLTRHVPEAAAIRDPFGQSGRVTLRLLLMHASGLQMDPPLEDPRQYAYPDPDEVLASLDRAAFALPPETQHKYSNIGFELLGVVVSRVTDGDYWDHVRRRILEPLGMSATGFDPLGALAGRAATPYHAAGVSDRPAPARRLEYRGADGGLWSSAEDLARWLTFQLGRAGDAGEAVLTRASVEEMHRPWVVVDEGWTMAQGLGWYWTRRGDRFSIGHSGGLPGFTSHACFSPAGGGAAVVLTNGGRGAEPIALDLLDAARADRTAGPPAAPPAPPPPALERLLGRYLDEEDDDELTVEWRDGRLVLGLGDGPRDPLEPTDDPLVFTVRGGWWAGEPARFLEGAGGAVDALNVGGTPAVRLVPATG